MASPWWEQVQMGTTEKRLSWRVGRMVLFKDYDPDNNDPESAGMIEEIDGDNIKVLTYGGNRRWAKKSELRFDKMIYGPGGEGSPDRRRGESSY